MLIVDDLNTEVAKIHPDAFLSIEEHKKTGGSISVSNR